MKLMAGNSNLHSLSFLRSKRAAKKPPSALPSNRSEETLPQRIGQPCYKAAVPRPFLL